MKRYYVFAGESYYPGGGTSDFVSFHDTLFGAMEEEGRDWGEIADENMKEILIWDRPTDDNGFHSDEKACWCVSLPRVSFRRVSKPADREWAIRFDVPLSADAPREVVIDWLADNGREAAAEYLRGLT